MTAIKAQRRFCQEGFGLKLRIEDFFASTIIRKAAVLDIFRPVLTPGTRCIAGPGRADINRIR
jgi:hypothetical protein